MSVVIDTDLAEPLYAIGDQVKINLRNSPLMLVVGIDCHRFNTPRYETVYFDNNGEMHTMHSVPEPCLISYQQPKATE